jgi:hypothetical protein
LGYIIFLPKEVSIHPKVHGEKWRNTGWSNGYVCHSTDAHRLFAIEGEEEEKRTVTIFPFLVSSSLENSHKKSVTDIKWIQDAEVAGECHGF